MVAYVARRVVLETGGVGSTVRRILKLTAIGCGGLLELVVFLGIVGAIIGGGSDTSSPPEKAEKRKGVEQAEKEQSKDPPQDVEKEEPDAGAEPVPEPSPKIAVKIERVVDGDTIEISPAVDGEDTVRLIGIDAPEEETEGCGAQPLAQEATEQMSTWEGSEAKLEFDKDRTDQYGRLLAYVHVHAIEDIMVNEDMVLGGLAQVYIVPPNTKHEDRLRKAQKEAKENPIDYMPSIWTLSAAKQNQLADHGNGIGSGDGACPATAQSTATVTATATATATASPNPSPNRNADAPNPNAPGTATASPSPAAEMSPEECISEGGRPVVPGTNGDGDEDGCAGEGS